MEWQAWRDNQCSGCGQPRDESFAKEHSFSYEVEPLRCHACAARERRAHVDNENRSPGNETYGTYYAVHLTD